MLEVKIIHIKVVYIGSNFSNNALRTQTTPIYNLITMPLINITIPQPYPNHTHINGVDEYMNFIFLQYSCFFALSEKFFTKNWVMTAFFTVELDGH